MLRIDRNDFVEHYIVVWATDCPICGERITLTNELEYAEEVFCPYCYQSFQLEG